MIGEKNMKFTLVNSYSIFEMLGIFVAVMIFLNISSLLHFIGKK